MNNEVRPKLRVYYIDNLRIFLSGLVVLHHFAITYSAPGGWYYNESEAGFPEVIPLSLFVATNQAFFMGMFFFISAYFVIPSLQKKGVSRFSKDRLTRLGIPMLLFFFVLNPLTIFIRDRYIQGEDVSLLDYIFVSKVFGFGPMWFVEALLLFTFGYLLLRKIKGKNSIPKSASPPGTRKILLFALLVALGQFIIRLWLPVGWSMPFTNFQFSHFLQYIFLFTFGIVAYDRQWLDKITPRMGWNWFIFVQMLIFVIFPTVFVLSGAADNGTEPFKGGFDWRSLTYAIWEQLVGIGMIVALFGIFKSRFDRQGTLAKKLSASAYGVYVFHPPLLLAISALFLDFNIPQIWKLVVLAPIALLVCFGGGYLVKQLPWAKHVF